MPAELTIHIEDGGDWRLKPRVDDSIRHHSIYKQVLSNGGRLILRHAEAPDGNPIPGRARDGTIAGIPRGVDYDWMMRGSTTQDSLVGWRRDGEMTVYRATLAGEPTVTRTELTALVLNDGDASYALRSLTRPPVSYPVGEWVLESDWDGRARNGRRALPVVEG